MSTRWLGAPRSRHRGVAGPARLVAPGIAQALLRVGLVIGLVYGGLAAGLGWWQFVQAGPLTDDPANPLALVAAGSMPRGRILDARGAVLAADRSGADGEPTRRYPFPVMAPIVGYRSEVFGTAGLERTYDAQLLGLHGLDPAGGLLRKFRAQAYDPWDLHLSVDLRLQRRAAELLGDDRGAIIALEPGTGRVLAMVSSPTFDPNGLADPGSARAYLDELRTATDAPLLSRATQGLYVPGSVFKVVTAVAGLESGAIDPETRFAEQPSESRTGFRVGGFRVRDAPRSVQLDDPLDLAEAMEVSSNVYFARVGLETGARALVAEATRLGFGAPIAFETPTESSRVNGGDGPLAGFDDRVELANAAYGQAEVLVTPLQMALVVEAVANGGELIAPRLVDRLVARGGSVDRLTSRSLGRAMSVETATAVRDAMVRAVEGPFADDYAGAARVDGVPTAGKSGTAELDDGALPHSWFVGFAPAEEPRIVVVVVVENAGSGSGRAVPLAGRLMSAYLSRAR